MATAVPGPPTAALLAVKRACMHLRLTYKAQAALSTTFFFLLCAMLHNAAGDQMQASVRLRKRSRVTGWTRGGKPCAEGLTLGVAGGDFWSFVKPAEAAQEACQGQR